ncbi:MAG TPA: Hsp20/alpha crystallin family protein [Gaiella sp.]|jgi:HSP20 family protein|nr:Hsp20/alpha crystallin family protein [Gaiella sp.]
MTIVRWAPLQDLDTIERRMRRMFDQGVVPAWPAADVYEENGEFVYELEVPGYDEKELAVEVRDHMLTVKGEKVEKNEEKEKTFYLNERLARSFERRFELPADAVADKVVAKFDHGVLVVHAPKAAEAAPKKVAITTAG